ncbi:type 1 glutamine amidotransferase family protein [Muricoccus pecuniae]|uniref:Putative intracellular protease/amidase n=1 Tax=Muricoccus pecuniae TaxID=693023 RepID=A0A840YM06_9PROT|nr:hypothetical protein [Roseomonas pecuniae]MBB5696252.1 putative intracellular protease/amidase [Roseomonas pecuniae]
MPAALQAAGGAVTSHPIDFALNVVVDRKPIAGQNPASDHLLATALIEALDRPLATA